MKTKLITLFTLVTLLAACAQPAGQPSSGGGSTTPAAPKTLTMGLLRGLPDFSPFVKLSASTSASNIAYMVNDALTYVDDRGVSHPLKAFELPSFERGTWKVLDDGRMETTWRLHPNIYWHDGTPQTTADYQFAYQVEHDRDLPTSPNATTLAMTGVSSPDAQTVVVSWSSPISEAGTVGPNVLPRHLLNDAYEKDKQVAFVNHPYWTHEYVSDGPYKIVSWELGSDMELARFDQYYLGRPNFDKVFVKVIGDPQALISNILAGSLDIVLPPGIGLDAAVEVRNRWAGTGNEVRADVVERVVHLEIQFRPDQAKPQYGFAEQPVRQALYQAINRSALAEFMTLGFAPSADSWYLPEEPRRTELAIPQYPYDLSAAPALLAKVGWAKGVDGVLTNSRSGEPFKASIWANAAAGFDKLGYAVAEDWKALGAQTEVFQIPAARTGDREYEMGYPGAFVANVPTSQFVTRRLHSGVIPSAATRFNGNNRGGYSNPQTDTLYDQLVASLDPAARTPVERQLVGAIMGDLALMPFYWETLPVLKLKGIKDHKFATGKSTWFFFDWDREL